MSDHSVPEALHELPGMLQPRNNNTRTSSSSLCDSRVTATDGVRLCVPCGNTYSRVQVTACWAEAGRRHRCTLFLRVSKVTAKPRSTQHQNTSRGTAAPLALHALAGPCDSYQEIPHVCSYVCAVFAYQEIPHVHIYSHPELEKKQASIHRRTSFCHTPAPPGILLYSVSTWSK